MVVAAFALAVMRLGHDARDARRKIASCSTTSGDGFDVGGLQLDIAFWLDPLSMVMVLIITGVGGLIHIYSTGYMHDDESYWRFFGWLNLFTFAMLVLVLGDNLWLMFVGWEGVGLCSFALIGFWYKVLANTTAGNKAFIVNRVGDWAFVIALYSAVHGTRRGGTSDPGDPRGRALRAAAGGHAGLLRDVAGHVRDAADVRRARPASRRRFRCHVWLPDAMAGPTPVSALIHAATMVTAGVYMVARLNFLFSMAPATMLVVATVGTLTAFFAATIGIDAERHQEGAGLFDRQPTRLHVRGGRRGRVRRRRLPPDDARVLQGLPVPRLPAR